MGDKKILPSPYNISRNFSNRDMQSLELTADLIVIRQIAWMERYWMFVLSYQRGPQELRTSLSVI